MKSMDKYRGCLIGGAVGDALGYPIEFLTEKQILDKYGKNGITAYSLKNGIAQISDDTQMTLFTANGLLVGAAKGEYIPYISDAYSDWLLTQGENQFKAEKPLCSWLNNIKEMHHSREPGRTCIMSIMNGANGTMEKPINHSKGCGGIMRAAPIGLYFENTLSVEDIDMLGAQSAALTHGHELGYIPAAMFVHIIHTVSHNPDISLLTAINDAKLLMPKLFPNSKHMHELISLVDKAITLSTQSLSDFDAIRQIGEGWVAEETLAIAIYCALKYSDNFEKAIITSVNHSGDSDSTGSVTGNIMGAYLGLSQIPQKFIDNLELKNVIIKIADDLYNDYSNTDEEWQKKYYYNTTHN